MRFNLSVIFFFLFPLFSNSQGIIKGKITESIYGFSLDNVKINLGDKTSHSDENGNFSIPYNQIPFDIKINDFRYYPKLITVTSTDFINIKLTNRGFVLDQIIINSDLNIKKLKNSSVSTSIVSDLEIKDNEGQFIINSINEVAGLFAHSAGFNTNRITIRGMGSRSPYSTNKIKAYINNIPLTNGVGELNIEDLGLNIFEQIEINKGPNSSIYGSGLGGSIFLKTKKIFENKIKLSSSFKSFNTFQNRISFSKNFKRVSAFVNFENFNSDGYRENNTYKSSRFYSYFKYEINNKLNIDLLNFINKTDALIPSSLNYNDYIENPSKAANSWKNIKGGENYSKSISGISVNYKNGLYNSNTSLYFKTFFNDENRPFNYLEETSHIIGLRHYGTFKINDLDLSYGLDYSKEEYTMNTYDEFSLETDPDLHQDEQRNNLNLFLQYEQRINSKSNIILGIGSNNISYNWLCCDLNQKNSLNYKYKHILSPRLSYNYEIEKHSIFLNISHGYSSPNINETLDENGLVNNNIKPETGWNYEIGVIGSSKKNILSYNLNFYFMDIKNLLVAQRTNFDSFIGVNAGRSSHPGIELSTNFLLYDKKGINLTLSNNLFNNWYTFRKFNHRGNDYSQNKITGVPSHTFFSKLKFGYKDFIASLIFNRIGKMPITDSNELFSDEYSLFDFKIARSFYLNKISLNISGGINNIFDKKYVSGIVINARGFGGREPRYYYPGLPRNYFLSFSLSL